MPARANTLPLRFKTRTLTDEARPHDDAPRFWRDAALPFIEARAIGDGRKVCYSRHSHDHFSIGAITAGRSTYIHERSNFQVESGTVVLMNPGDVHACNPIDDQPWSYVMLYVDTLWLRDLQRRIGFDESLDFQGFATTHSRDVELFAALGRLYEQLVDERLDTAAKHAAAEAFSLTCNNGSIRPVVPTGAVIRA